MSEEQKYMEERMKQIELREPKKEIMTLPRKDEVFRIKRIQ